MRRIPTCDPSTAGVTVPKMRAKWRRRVRPTWLETRTATLSEATGLMTSGLPVVATLNCVFCVNPSTGKEKLPVAVVSCALPTFWKPAVNGNALACSVTARLALPVPERVPCTTTVPPNRTGLGEARICSESGTFSVRKDRSAPIVAPAPLTATRR